MGKERVEEKGWWVWLAVWAGPIISIISILLYAFVLDIDLPAIKPRSGVENSAAAIVYIAHCGNIIAAFVVAFAFLQEEHNIVLLYMGWQILYFVLVIILIPLSVHTVLPHIPGRIILHVICLLISIWSFLTAFNVFRQKDRYDWDPRHSNKNKNNDFNGFNNPKMSMETGVL